MKFNLSKILILTVIIPAVCVGFITHIAQAYTSPGKATGFVNDFADMISAQSEAALEAELTQFQKETSNEISVVTIPTLDGDTIENYSNLLFNEWGIGGKEKDNGILLLVARDDREMRIEVGYGLEGALTDLQSSWIINKVMVPAFREGNFDGGITQAAQNIMAATKGEFAVPEDTQNTGGSGPVGIFAPLFFFLILWVPSTLARSKSWWAGGIVGGVLGIIIGAVASSLLVGGIAFLALGAMGLLFDYIVSKAYGQSTRNGTNPPWWIGGNGFGGGSGGFGGGGGGFGGFSGGSSGGGGASGRW